MGLPEAADPNMAVAGIRHIEEAVVDIVEDKMWIERQPVQWVAVLLSLTRHRSRLV